MVKKLKVTGWEHFIDSIRPSSKKSTPYTPGDIARTSEYERFWATWEEYFGPKISKKTPNNNTWQHSTSEIFPDPDFIIIVDENGNQKKLGVAEVSRLFVEANEYRRIKRFAKIFPTVKSLLNELLVAIKLVDPLDEEELNRIERENSK